MRLVFLAFLYCMVSASSLAQSSFIGHIYENKTRVALQGVTVYNQNNSQFVASDEKGKFTINAKRGDILILKSFAYKTDTLLITSLRQQDIMLEPASHTLNDVNVTATETKNADANVYKDPEYHGQSMVYQHDANDYYKGGIAIRLWYWNKEEKKLKKQADRVKYEQTSEEIFKLFSPENIARYLPLKGDDMEAFIIRYIPDVAVYAAASFNMMAYLNASYKDFKNLSPEDRRPQKLD